MSQMIETIRNEQQVGVFLEEDVILTEMSLLHETAFLSEAALAEDWNRPEEDAAWSYLQPAQ